MLVNLKPTKPKNMVCSFTRRVQNVIQICTLSQIVQIRLDLSVYYSLVFVKLHFDVGYPVREPYVGHTEALELTTCVVESVEGDNLVLTE